tara:strand:+ start:690 stop:1019 length:330 start_codon:yes stop_codon:yes gene_type:complete
MKFLMRVTLVPSTLTAHAALAVENSRHVYRAVEPIRIACYRGPLHATIWDAPEGHFVQDLVSFGYDFANADATARSVCKDQSLIGHSELLKTALLEKVHQSPPRGKRLR